MAVMGPSLGAVPSDAPPRREIRWRETQRSNMISSAANAIDHFGRPARLPDRE